jgi:hypothetical protein
MRQMLDGEEDKRVYMLRYDSVDYCIEAKSMRDAIDTWKEHVKKYDPDDGWDGDEDPEQVTEIHHNPVIRRD